MSPMNALTQVTDGYTAKAVVEALKAAGYIIVRHDAIRLAQAHAREERK